MQPVLVLVLRTLDAETSWPGLDKLASSSGGEADEVLKVDGVDTEKEDGDQSNGAT